MFAMNSKGLYRACLLLATALSAPAPAAPRAATQNPATAWTQATVDKIAIPHEKFTLPNGLTVILYPDRSQPKVFVSVTYRVGSKDEPEGKSGFAHLFEHLMFQETANRRGEYFTPLREHGVIDMNGNTTTDRTRYFQTVTPEQLDLALWLESDRMQHLLGAIDQKALDSQRAVVKNEKRQSETPGSAAQNDAFLSAMYPKGHPYAHSVIGSMADLDNASVDDVRAWFDAYYGAANAILLVAGDFDPVEARRKVAHYFSDVRPGNRIQSIAEWVPVLDANRRLRFFDKTVTRQISRSWPTPTGDAREGVLLNAFAGAIAGDEDSPLGKALVANDGPAQGVNASFSDSMVNGVFSINIDLKPGADPAEVNRRLDAALAALLRDGPDARTLARALEAKDISLIGGLEDPLGAGSMLEAGELAAGDPMFFKTVRGWEAQAKPVDVAAVARKWLTRPYIETEMLPEPKTEPAVAGKVDRRTMPDVPARAAAFTFPAVERATLANGAKVVVVRRPKLPMVDVSIQFDTGKWIDRQYPNDMAMFTFGNLFYASARFPEERLRERFRDLSLTPAAMAGDRRSTVQFTTLGPRLDAAMGAVAEVIREPAFPQKRIDEYLERVDQSYDGYERNPGNAQDTLFNRALWGANHLNGFIDDRVSGKALTRDKVLSFYRNELSPSNMTAYFVGDITLAQARALVERNFAGWHETAKPAPVIDTPPAAPGGVRVVLIDVPGAEQSKIMAGRLIGPWTWRGALVEQLTNGALGGTFTSRINMNLREDKGWSYGVSTDIGPSSQSQRTFYVSGAVQADSTAKAIGEIAGEIGTFTTTRPLTQAELDSGKLSILSRFGSGLNSNQEVMGALLDADTRGMPLDFMKDGPEVVRGISLKEAQDMSRTIYRTDDFVWTIAGDLDRIERDIRALNLGPIEVQDVYGRRIR